MAKGNAVNDETYAKLKDAWIQCKSIRRSAEAAGVSPATAAKYISSPVMSDGRPGIKAALAGSDTSIQEKLTKRIEQIRGAQQKQLLPNMIGLLIQELATVKLEATGERMANGTVVVDEKTYRRLFDMLKDVCEYDVAITQERLKEIARTAAVLGDDYNSDVDTGDEDDLHLSVAKTSDSCRQRSKADSILQRFERTHLRGITPDKRAAAQRGFIEAFANAAFTKKRSAIGQAKNGGIPTDYSEEEEELIAAN